MTTATSTITVTHEDVFVTASGRIKIAATTRKKYWRMWIYNQTTDTWQLQREIFKRREDAEAAAKLADWNKRP
jgi:hypothetical protein